MTDDIGLDQRLVISHFPLRHFVGRRVCVVIGRSLAGQTWSISRDGSKVGKKVGFDPFSPAHFLPIFEPFQAIDKNPS